MVSILGRIRCCSGGRTLMAPTGCRPRQRVAGENCGGGGSAVDGAAARGGWDARTDGLISRIQGHFKMRVYLINNNVSTLFNQLKSHSKELPLTFTIYSEASRRARHARHARRLTLPKTGGLAGAGVRNSYITPLRSTLALGIGVPWGRPNRQLDFLGTETMPFSGGLTTLISQRAISKFRSDKHLQWSEVGVWKHVFNCKEFIF